MLLQYKTSALEESGVLLLSLLWMTESPAALWGYLDSQPSTQSRWIELFYSSVKLRDVPIIPSPWQRVSFKWVGLTHGDDTSQTLNAASLKSCIFHADGRFMTTWPQVHVAAINEALQDKYRLLLVWKEVRADIRYQPDFKKKVMSGKRTKMQQKVCSVCLWG